MTILFFGYTEVYFCFAYFLFSKRGKKCIKSVWHWRHALYSKLLTHVWISQLAHALLPRTYHLLPIVEFMLLECPIREPHPQMGALWLDTFDNKCFTVSSKWYVRGKRASAGIQCARLDTCSWGWIYFCLFVFLTIRKVVNHPKLRKLSKNKIVQKLWLLALTLNYWKRTKYILLLR
jgi:hypothetical protein